MLEFIGSVFMAILVAGSLIGVFAFIAYYFEKLKERPNRIWCLFFALGILQLWLAALGIWGYVSLSEQVKAAKVISVTNPFNNSNCIITANKGYICTADK